MNGGLRKRRAMYAKSGCKVSFFKQQILIINFSTGDESVTWLLEFIFGPAVPENPL